MGFDFFGTKRKKEKLFLVLDIGTEAVKGLICKKENSKIVVLSASTQYFERYGVFDGRDFETDVIKRAILKTIKEAHQNLGAQRQNCKKRPVLVGLPPNILKGRIVWQSFKRDNSKKKISKNEQELIYQQVFKEAQKEISQRFTKEFGILVGDIQWITQKILEIKIDGYPVSELQGYDGKDLGIKILATFLPKYYFENIKKIFGDLQLKVFKIIHLAENLPIVLEDKIGDGIFLDVGGQATQIFLVRGGNLKQVNEFEAGGKVFSQELSEILGIDEESARTLKERYTNKLLSPEGEKRIKGMFLEEKRTWYENLKQSLPKEFFPSTIFLFGGGSLLPEIQEVLKENGIRVKFIYPKDLRDIEDTIKNLKSPQYVPSLLIF
ncbi:hypothetical protein KJA13_01905 [Patescibacteria group bacterium]|nr:hypothetical protein [Patescibacteria group bacterium]